MVAYLVRAVYLQHNEQTFAMIVCHSGSKKDVDSYLTGEGWTIKRISVATGADVAEVGSYDQVFRLVKKEIEGNRRLEALNRERAAQEARRVAAERAAAAAARRQAEEDSKDLALSRAIGDVLDCEPEPEIGANKYAASICAKTLLFFDHAHVNRKELFTAISIDFADFQSQAACPRANKLLTALMGALNDFISVDEKVSAMHQQMAQERASTENQVNSIGSRSHIFGGSGDGLWLSLLAANSAANADRRSIDALTAAHVAKMRQAKSTEDTARLHQKFLEYRAKTIVSLLLAACGKQQSIGIEMPEEVEQYVLKKGASLRQPLS